MRGMTETIQRICQFWVANMKKQSCGHLLIFLKAPNSRVMNLLRLDLWRLTASWNLLAWYKDVAIKADSSGDAAGAARTADTRGSHNDESWGNITSLVCAAHQRLQVPEPKHVWESGFWKSIFEPSTDPFRDLFTEQIDRPAQPSGTSLQTGEESFPARMVVRQVGRGSFLQAVKNPGSGCLEGEE